MKTAVVTGATGFIGRALTKRLVESGVAVFAIGQNKGKLADLDQMEGVTALEAVSCPDSTAYDCIPCGIDVFFHCAFTGGFGRESLKNYTLQLKNTELACDAVSQAAKMSAGRFVFVSTVNTVELRTFIGNEAFCPRGTCIYAAGKLAAELIGKTIAYSDNMLFCTALIAMPYGEGNTAATLPNVVIKQLLSGIHPKLIEGKNKYDLVYVDDVARGLQAIGESGKNFRDYYVGHRELLTFRNWIEKIRDVLAPDMELTFGEYPDEPALDYSLLDLNALYDDTGFTCSADFEDSIRKTAEWVNTLDF